MAVATYRTVFGARGSFTGDDWGFRAAMSGPLSLGRLFQGHNGHLNPIGLLLQWLVQHVFPGRYVPLMVVSALLVAAAAGLAAWWFQTTFGRRWAGISVALVVGISPMMLELITWWSVALYAAPLILTSWMTVQFVTLHVLGRASTVTVLTIYSACLLSSSKAVVMPILMVGLVAGLALGESRPRGYRRAIREFHRLWLAVLGLTAAYLVLFSLRRDTVSGAKSDPGQWIDFSRALWRIAVVPAVWGAPWKWHSFGFHNMPAPTQTTIALSGWGLLLAAVFLLALRPRLWRLLSAAVMMLAISTAVLAIGRAGGIWTAPNLRYTVDLLLPIVVVGCTGLYATRWETNARSALGQRTAAWPSWPWLGAGATLGWIIAVAVSMVQPWQTLPGNPMKDWVDNVRASYPALGQGLLWQYAPHDISVFPEPIDTFLAGDPGKPPQRQYVLDRALGFDARGLLIDRYVAGVEAYPPLAACAYNATKIQEAYVPLQAAIPYGRHTVSIDYSLGTDTSATLSLGDSPSLPMHLPAGARRVYAVLEGQGDYLRLGVGEPNANLCVHAAVVGELQDGLPVPVQ